MVKFTRSRGLLLSIALPATLAACATAPSTSLQPFSTDGCSSFPDRALIGTTDWCSCCLAHDLAYWRGGTAEERLKADQELKDCVHAASGSPELADLMFAGVRMGGGPYFFTTYRWGYGWSNRRLYQALSPEEDAQAAVLRSRYIESNPALACPTGTAPPPPTQAVRRL